MKNKKLIFIIVGIVLLIGIISTCILLKKKPTKLEEITITFNVDGGTEVENIKIKKGTEIKLPKTVKDGYNFMGWYIDDEKLEDKIILNEDKIITAKWEQIPEDAKTFIVTFNSNGGTSVDKLTVECDKELTLPANPKKEGYTFLSWVDQNERPIYDQALLTCEDITLYANWEKVEEKKETVQEQPKEKKYTCPEGYELKDNNKCVSTKSPENYCPEGMKYSEKASVCYTWSGEATKTCKNGGTLIKREHANDLCGYEEITRLMGSVDGCRNEGGTMYNNHCYKRVENSTTMFDYSCPGLTSYRTATDLGGTQNSGCYTLKQRDYGCKNAGEGYSMNHTIGKCVKTIDATLN